MLILLIACGLFLATVGSLRNQSTSSEPQTTTKEERGSLMWYVKRAKANGQTEITIPASIVDYGGSSSSTTIGKVLSLYDCVIATPIDQVTTPYSSDSIVTWFKLKTVEVISKASSPQFSKSEEDGVSLPKQLYPITEDEFVIAQYGGTLVIDRVKLTKTPEYPPFQPNNQYLLFIRRHTSGKVEIVGGPIGAFRVDENANLTPLVNAQHPLIRSIRESYNNSLENVRNAIKLNRIQN
jgi:hypothetical protein